MKITSGKLNLSFIGVESFLWAGMAVYFPFFVPFLKSCGYNEITIGIITSIMSVVNIAAAIFWGMASDRIKRTKLILAVNIMVGCMVMQLIPAATANYALLLAVLFAVNFTFSPQSNLLDAWIMRLKSHGAPVNYGLVRGAGSLAFAGASIAAGFFLSRFPLNSIFPLMLGFQSVTVVCILLVKQPKETPVQDLTAAPLDETGIAIHKNRPYIVFVLLNTLLFVGYMPAINFFWILLQSTGGTTMDLGIVNCLSAVSEFPVMFLSARLLNKYKDTTLLLISMAFYAIRVFLFFAIHSASGLIWAQLTESLSYGLMIPASVHYICRITPGRQRATALSLASSIYMGASGMVGNLLGGILINACGIRALYLWAGVLAAAVTVAFGVVLGIAKKPLFSTMKNRSFK